MFCISGLRVRKMYLLIFLFLYYPTCIFSQNSVNDTILNKPLINVLKDSTRIDSLTYIQDSIESKLISDTLDFIIHGKELNHGQKKDSILNIKSEYSDFTNNLRDSLIFENPDSVFYVAKTLNSIIDTNKYLFDDTTKRAISKLIYLSENRKAKKAIAYLQNKLNQSDFLIQKSDSTNVFLNDSIRNILGYLLKNLPEDSIQFAFTNAVNDSVLFSAKENETDSIHLKLYDNRGEFVVLWIKKSDKDVFEVFLEDGVYLEKAKEQETVLRKIDTNFKTPGLRKVKKVELIIPIWKLEGSADIKFNQGYLENWAEGGENSMSATSVVKFSADYSYGKRHNLDSDVEYRLGYLQSGTKSLQKNDDKFELNVKYGKQAFNNWYYSALLNFKTQFFEGYEYPNDSVPVSEFMSPAYLVFSLGMDFKPSNKLTFMVSPLASKFTIVADTIHFDQTRFGVGADEKIRKEVGAYLKAISKIRLAENIMMENKLSLFTNYIKNPQNVDLDWEMDIKMKLNDFIKVSVNTHMIYDDDIEFPVFDNQGVQIGTTKKLQFKELFGIGFTYEF